jgi:hypothetical protein
LVFSFMNRFSGSGAANENYGVVGARVQPLLAERVSEGTAREGE